MFTVSWNNEKETDNN